MAGWLPLLVSPSAAGLSKRSVININFSYTDEYRFINHITPGVQFGPSSNTFRTGRPTYAEVIDSSGWPNQSILTAAGKAFGSGISIPPGWMYGDVGSGHYYVFEFDGNGEWTFNTNTFTRQTGSVTGPTGSISEVNVNPISSNRWSSTAGSTHTRLIFNYTGPATAFTFLFSSNDPGATGANVRNVRFIRLDDLADYNAGNLFRTPYKQQLVSLCPSAIRFMDWHGGNANAGVRFTDRTLPNYAGDAASNGAGYNWFTSPVYNPITFVDASLTANQYTTSAAPTSGNPKTMPVSMKHGEICLARIDTAIARTTSGFITVSGVSNATTGVVTTSGAHGYNNGDIVALTFSALSLQGDITNSSPTITNITPTGVVTGMRIDHPNIPVGTKVTAVGGSTVTMSANATATLGAQFPGFYAMPNLQNVPIKVTSSTSNTFQMFTVAGAAINTTAVGAFGGTCRVNQYITLNVGGRGAYPIVFPYGNSYAGHFGDYMKLNNFNLFVFDKSISMTGDGAGNQIFGCWIMRESPNSDTAHDGGGMPIEFCVALVNEINAMGPVLRVSMWINIPYLGMSSMDPDYSAADNWGIGIANVVLNGAGGYPGLAAPTNLFIEYGNETWNAGGSSFPQAGYLGYRGVCRWGNSGSGNFVDMATLRSTVAMNDIKNSAYYDSSRVKFVLSGQGSLGTAAGGLNQLRIDGNTFCMNDANYPNVANAPMTYHDHFAFAAYFWVGSAFESANLATLTSNWATAANAGNTANMNTAIASYVTGLVNLNGAVPSGGLETTWRYGNTLVPQFSSKMAGYGKSAIMYEGGWDATINLRGNPLFTIYVTASMNATTTLSGLDASQVSSYTVGDFVYGYGIPANTSIASKGTTTLTLTRAATITQVNGQIMVMSPQDAFLWAVKRSSQWSTEIQNYFNTFTGANLYMPSDYVQMNPRWGHMWPTAYGYSNTEWGDLSQVILDEGTRNRALPS